MQCHMFHNLLLMRRSSATSSMKKDAASKVVPGLSPKGTWDVFYSCLFPTQTLVKCCSEGKRVIQFADDSVIYVSAWSKIITTNARNKVLGGKIRFRKWCGRVLAPHPTLKMLHLHHHHGKQVCLFLLVVSQPWVNTLLFREEKNVHICLQGQ